MTTRSLDDPYLLTVVFDETHGSLIEEVAHRVSDVTDTWYACYLDREELEAYVRPSPSALDAVDGWLARHGIRLAAAPPSTTSALLLRDPAADRERLRATGRPSGWIPTWRPGRTGASGRCPRDRRVRAADPDHPRRGSLLEFLDGTYWLQTKALGQTTTYEESKPDDLAGLSPADVERIYDVPTDTTGSGETIAVLMLSHAPAADDVTHFWECQGIQRVRADGSPSRLDVVNIGPEPAPDGGLGALESAMVTEWAGAMAPGAHVVVYVVDERLVADPWAAFLLAVIGDKKNQPTIAVTTWLLPERQYYNAHGAGVITGLLNQCAALGITVLSASGDWGCFDSFPRTKDSDSHTVADAPWPHAVFPAVEEKVLAVGGTMVTQMQPLTEQAWSGPLPVSLYNRLAFATFAGGGGFSMEVPIPEWQRPFLLRAPNFADKKAYSRGPDVPAVLAYGRGLPDVALASTTRAVMTPIPADQRVSSDLIEDLTTEGYQALVDGTWIGYAGGTSMAAPVWAAFIARLNEARATATAPARESLVGKLRTRMTELAKSPEVDPDRTA
ncbi:MAG: protease pro-enzyme activation domain-containing protein [bacterium]